jgi:hypothetical protein
MSRVDEPAGQRVGDEPPGAKPPAPPTPSAPDQAAPPNAATVIPSAEYGQWARNQRPPGTVYGGPGQRGHHPAAAVPGPSTLENSGSLTGHILAHGTPDVAEQKSRTKVIVIMAVIAASLIAVGLVASGFLGESVRAVFGGLLTE